MVLKHNIPEEVKEDRIVEIYLKRMPNYCDRCGAEMVVAGGRLKPEMGWYEHLDPVLQCSGGCDRQIRLTMGTDRDDSMAKYSSPGIDTSNYSDYFGDIVGYCDIHGMVMEDTKDLLLGGRPTRQYKCPECNRENVVQYLG